MPVRLGLLGLLTIALALFTPARALAVTIRTIEITQTQETYHVTFDVLLATEPEKTWLLLSDYHQWPLLSDNLEESKLLELLPDGRQRVRLRFRSCVLIFCKAIQQVKDVKSGPEGNLLTEMVPEQGDFASGWERWRIRAEQNETQVEYTAEIVPSFSLPPLIGPMILKGKLRSTLIETAKKLEALPAP